MRIPIVICSALLGAHGTAADIAEHLKGRATQFSCDETMTTGKGATTMHLVQDGEKTRTETERNGMHVVMIARRDQQKMYMVMVERKMVMELPYDPRRAQRPEDELAGEALAKVKAEGSETIRDVVCDKFTRTGDDGRVSTFWISQKDHVTMRWQDGAGTSTVDFDHYALGPQDAALFEPPAGYQRMAAPGAPAR